MFTESAQIQKCERDVKSVADDERIWVGKQEVGGVNQGYAWVDGGVLSEVFAC